MHRLNELSACEIARGVVSGRYKAEAVTRACLDRVEARDKQVKAWAFIDPDLALNQARAIDKSADKGPLAGVPLGIKDIIDTFDMPTDMGSPIYRGHRTASDASCVALARRAGAVILGKTVTCEFAGLTPNVTRNPHNLDHTPGGSSSGSGAAVADNMVAVAYGTQTGGSVLRPASFCGAVGYKPTYNLISRGGIRQSSPSDSRYARWRAAAPMARPPYLIDRSGESVRSPQVDRLQELVDGRPFQAPKCTIAVPQPTPWTQTFCTPWMSPAMSPDETIICALNDSSLASPAR